MQTAISGCGHGRHQINYIMIHHMKRQSDCYITFSNESFITYGHLPPFHSIWALFEVE